MLNRKVNNKAAPLHAMKTYGGVDAWLHLFLSSALDEGACCLDDDDDDGGNDDGLMLNRKVTIKLPVCTP